MPYSRAPWFVVALLLLLPSQPSGAAPAAKGEPSLAGLEWRSIGPFRGGRVTAVTGVVGQPGTYYFGGTGSGIWRTTTNGASWSNVSDGQLGTSSVGAIAVAESDPNVLYAGMGEGCIRGNVSHGDGVYRSTDGGRTWKNVGLRDSRQIGRIRIHPDDPDLVYVAALGHTFGPNSERGVYRTRDGGTTWQRVLFVNDSTGAVDLAMDARNPRILYAATWQVHRTPWSLESGGSGSGLFKSRDGGDTWTRITAEGLPKGMWGRVGIDVSPARPERLYAIIEADEGGVYRSDDGGRTWRRTNQERTLRQRAWYYSHVYADPKDADQVYVLNVSFYRSKDGGRTFTTVSTPHGDNHDLWIDPDQPNRMIEANDGGANVTLDGGLSWSRQDNQPTAQFYHVVTDDQFPYRLYGAQQDNSTVSVPSRTSGSGIGPADWYMVAGCECGYVTAKRGDPDITYGGCYGGYIGRLDRRTEQERDVSVYPENPMGWGAEGMKYRFQWTFPIVTSPHDANTLYATGNVVFRTTDEGQSWKAISPDLTRNDPARLKASGGPITRDNTSVEYYCTIFAFAESKLAKGLLWAGSDDGLVHVSRDAGAHWTAVTPRGLPAWSQISQIDPSPHDPATAYLAVNRYKLDDYKPYAFVTKDYGKSWKSIAAGIPEGSFVRAVREDPVVRGLLYAGTETGVYWSVNDGASWRPLQMNLPGSPPPATPEEEEARRRLLPVTPITDLVVQDDDLVVATQGRSFWILDDVGPLREIAKRAVTDTRTWLYAPGTAHILYGAPGGPSVGRNPPSGALVYYQLARKPKEKEEVALEFLDVKGSVLRRISNIPRDEAEGGGGGGGGGEGGGGGAPPAIKLPAQPGLNRFAWDLREEEASRFPGMILWSAELRGPTVVPGNYQVRLTAFGDTLTRSFEVKKDPRLEATPQDLKARHDLQLDIRNRLTAMHDAIARIRDIKDQLKSAVARSRATRRDSLVAPAADSLTRRLTAVEEALYQTKNQSVQDPLNYPIRLNNKLGSLAAVVASADARPTDAAVAVHADLTRRIEAELAKLKTLVETDLAEFNRLVRDQEVPAVAPKPKKGPGVASSRSAP